MELLEESAVFVVDGAELVVSGLVVKVPDGVVMVLVVAGTEGVTPEPLIVASWVVADPVTIVEFTPPDIPPLVAAGMAN